MKENIKVFKIYAKCVLTNLLAVFPKRMIVLQSDYEKDFNSADADFASSILFLKECKVLDFERYNAGAFIGARLSPKAYLYLAKNDLKDIDDLIEFCME